MKRDELKALGLTDEQIDKVMNLHGADITSFRAQIQQKDEEITRLTTERDSQKTQLEQRDKDIADLQKKAGDNEALTAKITELQAKYDKDTADLHATLDEQARDHATDNLFASVKFTSSYAKKAAIAEFKAAKHEFKDGKFVGGEAILKQMQKDNPDAFVAEEDKGGADKGGGNKPTFTKPLGGDNGGGNGGDKNPFHFGFTAVRSTNKK